MYLNYRNYNCCLESSFCSTSIVLLLITSKCCFLFKIKWNLCSTELNNIVFVNFLIHISSNRRFWSDARIFRALSFVCSEVLYWNRLTMGCLLRLNKRKVSLFMIEGCPQSFRKTVNVLFTGLFTWSQLAQTVKSDTEWSFWFFLFVQLSVQTQSNEKSLREEQPHCLIQYGKIICCLRWNF